MLVGHEPRQEMYRRGQVKQGWDLLGCTLHQGFRLVNRRCLLWWQLIRHTGGEKRRFGLATSGCAASQDEAHILPAALEHLDVPLLLPKDHVPVVPVVGRSKS